MFLPSNEGEIMRVRTLMAVLAIFVLALGVAACSGDSDLDAGERNQEIAKRGFKDPKTLEYGNAMGSSAHSGNLGSCRVRILYLANKGLFVYESEDGKLRVPDVSASQLLARDEFAACRPPK